MKKNLITLAAILCCAMTTAVLTACTSENDDNPTPVTPTEEPVDYTVIFYGHGGMNLDQAIWDNIEQFFHADAESFKKVNVVGMYKFSTEENMAEYGMPEQYAENLGGKTYRFVVNSKVERENAWLDPDNIYGGDNCYITHPDSLTNFINWAAKICPAKNYVLILSDHGGSYMPHDDLPYQPATRGVIYDDGHNLDNFSVMSLTSALRAASIRPQVIYMDACLMNTVEYQFELKDLCDYYVASTFSVPGMGGDYTTLINSLATTDDIEKALTDLVNSDIARWGSKELNGYETTPIFTDQTVTRTAKLNDLGTALKAFTDKLVEVYKSGDEAAVGAIDDCTQFAFKVEGARPSYDLIDYVNEICDTLPNLFTAALKARVNDAFQATIVKAGCSETLASYDLAVELSVLMGFDNCYVINDQTTGEHGEETDVRIYCYADGRIITLIPAYPDYKEESTWGSTFDATYKQLAFDKVVGWSRWIELNKQMPCQNSPVEWSADFFNDVMNSIQE